MKSYNSRELIKLAKSRGFVLIRVRGSHHQFKNFKTGVMVTIPHPRDDYKPKTLRSILEGLGGE